MSHHDTQCSNAVVAAYLPIHIGSIASPMVEVGYPGVQRLVAFEWVELKQTGTIDRLQLQHVYI